MMDQDKNKQDLIAELAKETAEEALRASEERFRVTFEEAPVGMAICGSGGVITKINRALCRISGYSEEELVGRDIRDLSHPEDREMSSPLLKRLIVGEIPGFTLERRYLRKGGQPFWRRGRRLWPMAGMARSFSP